MNQPKSILIYSHDWSYAFTKTTEFLGEACESMDIPTLIRDSCDVRASRLITETLDNEEITQDFEDEISRRINTLVYDHGIDCIIALDLGWLFIPDLFLKNPRIKKIYSIWFDDFISWCGTPNNAIFPYRQNSFQEVITHPKVVHCFYGKAIGREAARLGVKNQIHSNLAAPQSFLEHNFPCTIDNKMAFIGNPGCRQEPSKQIIKCMKEGATLDKLRNLSCQEITGAIHKGIWKWTKEHPDIKKLLATAVFAKREMPYTSALEILEACGEDYPNAINYLNDHSRILEAAHVIKFVLRYDRPAFVNHLYQKGLVDVISNEHEWKQYDIQASPPIIADKLPQYYMKYPAHLNAANAIRDATANEKLFEISACARTSINLNSPDVAACYDGSNEIYLANTFEEAEEMARTILKDPDTALSRGKRCRLRTAHEHTWEHRIKKFFSLKNWE